MHRLSTTIDDVCLGRDHLEGHHRHKSHAQPLPSVYYHSPLSNPLLQLYDPFPATTHLMRMQNSSSTCSYGRSSHAGYLFERQRAAMRQNSFARARTVVMKRKTRDDDNSSDDDLQPPASKKKLLEGLKRMRVSSPPSVPSSNSYATDVAMSDDDGELLAANARALVAVSRPRRVSARGFSTQWSPSGLYSGVSSDLLVPTPTDPSSRALVVFDTMGAIPRGPSPRVEMVESDDEQRRSDSEDEAPFVRFEEIYDDEDEPMEID